MLGEGGGCVGAYGRVVVGTHVRRGCVGAYGREAVGAHVRRGCMLVSMGSGSGVGMDEGEMERVEVHADER